jgi:hypothetical protein
VGTVGLEPTLLLRTRINVNASEEIVGWFQHHPYLKTEKPAPVIVREIKGVQFDYVVAEDSPDSAVKTFRYTDGLVVNAGKGAKTRVIILDVKGEAVSIAIGSATSEFNEFLPEAQKVLDTVKWGGS